MFWYSVSHEIHVCVHGFPMNNDDSTKPNICRENNHSFAPWSWSDLIQDQISYTSQLLLVLMKQLENSFKETLIWYILASFQRLEKNFLTSIRPLVDPRTPFDVFSILLSFLPFVLLKHHRQLVVWWTILLYRFFIQVSYVWWLPK